MNAIEQHVKRLVELSAKAKRWDAIVAQRILKQATSRERHDLALAKSSRAGYEAAAQKVYDLQIAPHIANGTLHVLDYNRMKERIESALIDEANTEWCQTTPEESK